MLAGLVLVEVTGVVAFDSIAALVVAAAIVFAGLRILTRSSRVLLDEAPPPEELDRIEAAIAAARPPEMVGYHKLRARRAGARDYIDLHVQFRSGTTLERAHALAHRLRDAIEAEVPDSDVLIHVEPEGAVHDPASRDAEPVPGRLIGARLIGEVDGRRGAHGGEHDRVARVSVQGQDQGTRSRRSTTMVSQEARASDTPICLPSGQRQRPARPQR